MKVAINSKGAGRVQANHPWVFRSDIVSSETNEAGSVVSVYSPSAKHLGHAFFNPHSQIVLRMISRQPCAIDQNFWKTRISESIARRKQKRLSVERPGTRLIHGESDLLPGLIADLYDKTLVFQTLSAGFERIKETLVQIFQELLSPECIIERNDPPVRELEGLVKQKGIIFGKYFETLIQEGLNLFEVDPLEGQKTGIFLDQAENHLRAGELTDGHVLDLFSYQGGFPLALLNAEEVTAIDSSAPALETLKKNALRNQRTNIHTIHANVFDYLREAYDQKRVFDHVILDPPPFMRSKKDREAGVRGYKEINLRAMKLVKPGGLLFTYSCSQNFLPELFEKVLSEAAHDAKRSLQIIEKRGAAIDHPVLLSFPESFYLQGYILRVL